MSETTRGLGTLVAGGLAAVLASACCAGPLVLLTLGISGAWMAHLMALEPYRPIFIAMAAGALFFAYRQVFRPAVACQPGEACAIPQARTTSKVLFGLVAVLALIAAVFPWVVPYFF